MKKSILFSLFVSFFAMFQSSAFAISSRSSGFIWDITSDRDWLNLARIIVLMAGFVIVLLILKRIFRKKAIGERWLVLSEYSTDKNAHTALYIEARKKGIISFLMKVANLHIDMKSNLIVDKATNTLIYDTFNIDGHLKTVISLKDVASMKFGYHRSLKLTMIIGLFLFIVLFMYPGTAIIGAIALAIWFYFSKSFLIEIETVWGEKITLGFSTSVQSLVKNLNMDQEKAQEIQDIIFNLKNKA